jgi:hypothetical protein
VSPNHNGRSQPSQSLVDWRSHACLPDPPARYRNRVMSIYQSATAASNLPRQSTDTEAVMHAGAMSALDARY